MEADTYAGRWTIIIWDEEDHDHGKGGHKVPAWKAALPLGSTFLIARDGNGQYWYLPGPEPKAPMNKSRPLTATAEEHAKFEVGALLPGSLCADLGTDGGKLYFSVNLIDGKVRIINLGQSHGGLHGSG